MRFLRLGAIALAAIFVFAGSADARTRTHAHSADHKLRTMHTKPVKQSVAHAGVMNAGQLTETYLPIDEVTTVDGMRMACTGIGLEAREREDWKHFRVRFEFSGGYNQYLPGGRLVIKSWEGRRPLVHVRCDAPWVLVDIEPGKYRVAGVMAGYSHPQSWIMKLKPNRKTARRIVLHFDEVVGSDP
jgi:hypothetical protein